MKKNSVVEIRQAFLDFFSIKNHQILPSSSLLPEDDASLLFTNSGMNQFKNVFLGLDKPSSPRVVTVQRCVRAGGKHNDLENVGYTGRHLTFFEMLGNFSFGDYFKEDAISFAWELLTSSHWFNLSKEKLFITVHANDEISYNFWKNKIGIDNKHIKRVGDKYIDGNCLSDNFWQMGNVGPCGPCSEIFYDCGVKEMDGSNPEQNTKDQYSNESCLEIWNLVFMEFNRNLDGTLVPLPRVSVDTGMGLERISSVLQCVDSNYDIDIFYYLMSAIAKCIGDFDFRNQSFRVIADHIRTCCFLIIDGVLPSNEGRGYVLRRIIRRAIRHGKILGIHCIFFYKLVESVIRSMGHLHAKLVEYRRVIERVLFTEEKKFSVVLENGLEMLNKELLVMNVGSVLSGEKAFYLYSTYGFPLQFMKNICSKKKVEVDEIGFNRAMLMHKSRAQQSHKFIADMNKSLLMHHHTDFVGYNNLSYSAKILSLFKDNRSSEALFKDELGFVVLDRTPFYGESGGQIGDCGEIKTEFMCFEVLKTYRYGQVFAHWGKVINGVMHVGDFAIAQVNSEYRKSVSLHHSATHLLSAALNDVLGNHVIQKGSLISNQCLRFDFCHHAAMSCDQICLVENIVNQQIRNNTLINSTLLPVDVAIKKGAKTVLGKKYGQVVRVLNIGDFSLELCGGTHVMRTGDIGFFVICNEYGIASGIRRIEARCGIEALLFFHEQRRLIHSIESCIKNHGRTVSNKVSILCSQLMKVEKQLEIFRDRQITEESNRLIQKTRCIADVKLIVDQVYNVNVKVLRTIVSNLKSRLVSGVVVLFFIDVSNVLHLVVGVTQDIVHNINAIDIINYFNSKIGGRGGGRACLAQSGGGDIKLLFSIIGIFNEFLTKKILSHD